MPRPEGVGIAELDLRGLRCPLPVLKTARRLASMAPGALLDVLTDDAMARIDLPSFCEQEGQGLLATQTDGTTLRFRVRRGARAPALDRRAPD